MSFAKSFEKTAVSRNWINDRIQGGFMTRAAKLNEDLKKVPSKQKAQITANIEKNIPRVTAREKALYSNKLSDKDFRTLAKKQVSDLKQMHKIPAAKSKNRHLKALAGGALALGAVGGAAAYLKSRKAKKAESEMDQTSSGLTA